jgi:microcin C transport system substrate-binding protein
MDKLIIKYRDSADSKERIKLSHIIQQKLYESGSWIPLEVIPFVREFYWRWLQFPDVPGNKETTEIFESPLSGGYFWIDEDIKKETLESQKNGKSFAPVTKIIDKYK